MDIRHFIIVGAMAIGGCTALQHPLEEAKPIESIRLSGNFAEVGRCLEHALHERDLGGHYEFVAEGAQGILEGNGAWEVVLRQETPTQLRAAVKTELTNAGAPKRPAGLSLLIATCAGAS